MQRLLELWPDFLLAWAGWMMHSLVKSAGHILKHGTERLIDYLKSS